MVAPKLPSQSTPRKRRKRTKKSHFDQRILFVPLLLASLAIGYNVLRLIRSLLESKTNGAPSFRREHAPTSSWNFNWCSSLPSCQYVRALDLQELLQIYFPEESEDGQFFADFIPDPQELFVLDDDNNNNHKATDNNNFKKNNTQNTPITDDLDNHPDHFGRLVIDAARFESWTPTTPRVLLEARRNKTQIHRHNATQLGLQVEATKGSHFALLSRRGLGDSHIFNQDRAVLIDPYPIQTTVNNQYNVLNNHFFLGIFDGHGLSGHVKSDHAATVLPDLLLQQLSYSSSKRSEAKIRQAFSTAFWQVHRQGPLIHDSGCTASIVVRLQNLLYVANTGDSRCMLVRIDPDQHHANITHITMPHKPNHPRERQRIVGAGCVVIDPIPFRDASARVTESLDGFGMALAMSRSIGDYDLEHCGVVPEPTVTVVDLNDRQYSKNNPIVLAVCMSDGIMDMVSLQEVANTLAATYWKDSTSNGAFASPLELAAEDLVRMASDRWLMNTTFMPYRDDITIAVRRVQ